MSGLQSVRVRRGEALALQSVWGSIGVVSVHASSRVRTGQVSVLQRIRVHHGGVGLIIFGSVRARCRFYRVRVCRGEVSVNEVFGFVEARCRFYKEFGSAEASCRFTKSSGP